MAETEFLRRLNQALPGPDAVPDWFYMWNVKETVAHRALAGRPSGGRLILPAERDAWAKQQSETLIGGLRASGYQIAGDLDDLRPPQERQRPGDGGTGPEAIGGFQGGRSPGLAGQPPASPSDQPAEAVLDAAVQATAALVVNQYQREYPAARPKEGRGRGLAGRIEAAAAALAPAQADGARVQQPLPGGAPPAGHGLAGDGEDQDARPLMADGPRVAAVVVTYNRRDLLLESLAAVLAQTRAPDKVIVVDNASEDGTAAAVRDQFPSVHLAELRRNSGGAGGFAGGMALALADGADLIWLMDDDTVPEPGALSALLSARDRMAAQDRSAGRPLRRWSPARCCGPTGASTR